MNNSTMRSIVANGIFLPCKAKEIGVVDYIIGKDCSIDEIL